MKVEPFKSSIKGTNTENMQTVDPLLRTNTALLNKNPVSPSTDNSRKLASDQISKNKENHFVIATLETIVILSNVRCLIALLRKAKDQCCH